MAMILKRCDCPRVQWGKCEHSWTVRWWGTDGKQHEKSFKRNHGAAKAFSKQVEAEKLSIHRGDPPPPADELAIEALASAGRYRSGRTGWQGVRLPQGPGVYVLWDESHVCLYVGQTRRRHPLLRIAQHARKSWWLEVADIDFISVEERVIDAFEQAQIRKLNPKHNDRRYKV
jgi:hypothetical protein